MEQNLLLMRPYQREYNNASVHASCLPSMYMLKQECVGLTSQNFVAISVALGACKKIPFVIDNVMISHGQSIFLVSISKRV